MDRSTLRWREDAHLTTGPAELKEEIDTWLDVSVSKNDIKPQPLLSSSIAGTIGMS